MTVKERILKDFDKIKGQFIITLDWKVERLVGIGEDKYDYFYITYNGRNLTQHSCVGKMVQLKGKLDDVDYNELERIADLNHYDRLIGETGYEFNGDFYTLDSYKKFLMKDWGKDDILLTNIIFKDESPD